MKKDPRSEWVYLRWFRYVWKHKFLLAAALLFILVVMSVDVFVPKVFGFVVDRMLTREIVSTGQAALPFVGSVKLTFAFLLMFGVLAVLLGCRSGSQYLRSVLLGLTGEKVHLDIRQALFDHLQRLPVSYFDRTYTGKIMARITTDTDALWHMLNGGMIGVFAPAVTVITVIVILFHLNVWLTVFSLAVLPLSAWLFWTTRKKQRISATAQREAVAALYSNLQERITGVRTIRIFGREKIESRLFMKELQKLFHKNIVLIRAFSTLSARTQLLTGLATAAILCFGGVAVAQGRITLGEMIQFYLYAGMLFAPVGALTETSTQIFTHGDVALRRIFEVLDMPVAREFSSAGRPCPRLRGGLELRNVSFGYSDDLMILKNVSLRIRPGETVAFVGPSGAGKTTLVNLICRFYQPQKGIVLADGRDVKEWQIESYRKQISYVSQESFLFSGTVYENVRFGKPGADRKEIERACRLANAHEFIRKLPKGYDSETGERGVTLSGGQKQRVNIARSLIVNPSIIVMDEPTSALDAESESVLLEALKGVFRDRTCLIIAHRLSTVMNADRIFVLNKGRIVQVGRHSDLVREKGLYAELCRKQFHGMIAANPSGGS